MLCGEHADPVYANNDHCPRDNPGASSKPCSDTGRRGNDVRREGGAVKSGPWSFSKQEAASLCLERRDFLEPMKSSVGTDT